MPRPKHSTSINCGWLLRRQRHDSSLRTQTYKRQPEIGLRSQANMIESKLKAKNCSGSLLQARNVILIVIRRFPTVKECPLEIAWPNHIWKKMNGISTVHSFFGGKYLRPLSCLRCCDWFINIIFRQLDDPKGRGKSPKKSFNFTSFNHSINSLETDWTHTVLYFTTRFEFSVT